LSPIWTRDGKQVTYFAIGGPDRTQGIYSISADRSGAPELIMAGRELHPASWTPDGQVLFTKLLGEGESMDIGIAAPGDSTPRWLFRTNANEAQPMVSPNGEWLAYTRENQVWLQPMRGNGAAVQVSSGLGESPRWSRDGRTLYYLSLPERAVMAVALAGATVTGRLTITNPIEATVQNQPAANWDLFPDERRILFVAPAGGAIRPRLVVLQNWPALYREMAGKP
jgi:Tol biopolymer transport system component